MIKALSAPEQTYNHMDDYNDASECEQHEKISVFSFCVDSKSHADRKSSSPTHSTASLSHATLTCDTQNPQLSATLDAEEILSMMDFFIGAKDYDSRADSGLGLLSNCDDADTTRSVRTDGQSEFSVGLDIADLKKARKGLGLRCRRVRKKCPAVVKNFFRQKSELQNAFLGMRRTLRRLGGQGESRLFRL